jgi:CRISPR-associated protein Cas2
MKLLLTYDISNSKNRTKLSTLLEGYGYRVNFSVFELDLKKHELKELLKLIEPFYEKEDSVRIYTFSVDTVAKSYDLNRKKPAPFAKRSGYVN